MLCNKPVGEKLLGGASVGVGFELCRCEWGNAEIGIVVGVMGKLGKATCKFEKGIFVGDTFEDSIDPGGGKIGLGKAVISVFEVFLGIKVDGNDDLGSPSVLEWCRKMWVLRFPF
ncbi:unnamed protein product [Meganyctiphanes norvegica]|uniref:Uncharacterized protein n=1 Tax=Meganyctiphanes norvegica TaxID=48144 RepID=A0AAV2PWG2_MEGNR